MSTLVNTKDIFKEHVTINFDFEFNIILPYIKKMERKHIKKAIGQGMYEDYTETPPESGNPLEVLKLLQESSSNLAMLEYTKVGIIQISNSGIFISTTPNATPAEWWQIRDLRRMLLDTGLSALDEALLIMEQNESDFEDWMDSQEYVQYRSLFCKNTQDFQQYYNINESALTFKSIKPHLLTVEDKYFEAVLGKETMDLIKSVSEEESILNALAICKAAQVSLTLSEIAFEGSFLFKPSGLCTVVEDIPGEKQEKLTVQELEMISQKKRQEGIEYLKKLKKHLEANPDIFTDFASFEATSRPDIAINKNSLLSL